MVANAGVSFVGYISQGETGMIDWTGHDIHEDFDTSDGRTTRSHHGCECAGSFSLLQTCCSADDQSRTRRSYGSSKLYYRKAR